MMGFADPLIKEVGNLNTGPTYFTKEILTDLLIKSHDGSLYLMVGEFSELIQKNKSSEMFDFLTSMYDNRDKLEVGTMKRGIEVVTNPSLNLFTATTPGWIAENMGAQFISGGLASRFIFVYEDTLRNPRLIYSSLMNVFNESEQSKLLVEDLKTISKLEGEFVLDVGMEDYINEWIVKHSNTTPSDVRMMGYHARKPMMILKLAMIYSAATRNELVLDQNAFDFGVYAVETTEKRLPKVFSGVGKNDHIFDMQAIVGYVLSEGKVSHEQILMKFQSVAHPAKLIELIGGCVAMGELALDTSQSKVYYTIPE
jgi:hypothetical protein